MKLDMHANYWDEQGRKQAFLDFIIRIHGLDLSLWDRLGYWDYDYQPYSYFQDNRIVSSVCLYSMDMIVQGRRRRVGQISGVGTLPDFRRRGLNRQLTAIAMEQAAAEHDFYYLFADEDAIPFYTKCGFRPAAESAAHISVAGRPPVPGARLLNVDLEDDRAILMRIASARAPVSDMLASMNPRLFMFHCLYVLRKNIYFVDELNIVILCEREAEHLKIYDIAASTMPGFDAIYPYISQASDKTVEFRFMTDKLQLADVSFAAVQNNCFVYGAWPFGASPWIVPSTAQA